MRKREAFMHVPFEIKNAAHAFWYDRLLWSVAAILMSLYLLMAGWALWFLVLLPLWWLCLAATIAARGITKLALLGLFFGPIIVRFF
jgi:hypothetical protein